MRGCKDAIREAPLCKLLGLCWHSWQPSVRRLVFAWIWLAGNSPLWCRKHGVSKCQKAVRYCVYCSQHRILPHLRSTCGAWRLLFESCALQSLLEMESPSSRIQTRFSAALVSFGNASYQRGTGLRRMSPGCPGTQPLQADLALI